VTLLKWRSAAVWLSTEWPEEEDGVCLSWLLEELLVCCLP